ncbi:TRM11 family methyltransferase [Croceibacter atlanticus]|uniref:site-specific DNA-methyltransferase (cytosine-N(4)-specific) n=1 Tax=Croceibacter atlanticus (strain ATCC BAA-628 / JCM 21780 / CIP 108009 / IAM 15332 / KCTC 12090 / HTCC2559) TaxID=216432 RepID=A3U4K4_CROAH|nr:hypothetical protein [Croceibacter atlanticus]EAP87171.1 adenine-specific DNA modification methyltransferase [Croceibacter atlanticus HTCC2559]
MLDLTKITTSLTLSKEVTHTDAKKEPLHNWFPYLEGFSETFIENILNSMSESPKFLYEPFSGSGTVPVFSKRNGIHCLYSEVNPFLLELTDLKISTFDLTDIDKASFKKELYTISQNIETILNNTTENKNLKEYYDKVFGRSIYFEKENFSAVLKLSNYIKSIDNKNTKQFLRIAVCNCLLPASLLKRAGDIRYKRGKEKNNIPSIITLLKAKLLVIADDLNEVNSSENKITLERNTNAKVYMNGYEEKIDAIITSPPYLNGTNYIRNTKLELWFLGYLKEKKDLSRFRKEVVTAGINDVSKEEKKIIIPFIQDILDNKDLWYDKRIPKMITDYFFDMKIVIENFYKYLKKGGKVFLDIGDSVYANQHIPTDLILIELFKNEGFTIIDNLKLRDRRSKSGRIVKQCLIVAEK